jgi:hypothetical protein
MKKPYQIEPRRAVKELEAMAADGNPAVADGRDGGLDTSRRGRFNSSSRFAVDKSADAGRSPELVGERSQRQAERTASRWGSGAIAW